MRQSEPTAQPADQVRARPAATIFRPDRVMRGVVHAVILALAAWLAVVYLAFILR